MTQKLFFLVSSVIISGCSLVSGCSLDSKYFSPKKTESYVLGYQIIPESSVEELSFSSQGETLYGVLVKSSSPTRRPTLIYHQGYDKNIDNFWSRIEYIYPLDYNIFIYDYQGFGKSTGSPTLNAVKLNAQSAWDYLLSRSDINTQEIHSYGYSMGGVFASHVAANHQKPKSLILEATPASTKALIKSTILVPLPPSFLFNESFDTVSDVSAANVDVLMLYSQADHRVHFGNNAIPMYQATTRLEKFEVETALHRDIPTNQGLDRYREVLGNFISAHP